MVEMGTNMSCVPLFEIFGMCTVQTDGMNGTTWHSDVIGIANAYDRAHEYDYIITNGTAYGGGFSGGKG